MRKVIWFSAAVLALSGANAWAKDVSFSAEMVQTHPVHGTQQGHMFVAPEGMRMEVEQQGRHMVQIMLPKQGIMRVLFPDEKTYIEAQGQPNANATTGNPDTPCSEGSGLMCEAVGKGTLSGIAVDKYAITPPQGKGTVVIWWDPVRKMPLRHDFPDGGVRTSTLKGTASHEGRTVESWETTMTGADGKSQSSKSLFDPEIGMAVREELPDGEVHELRKIKIVQPDPAWFAVPSGFRKVEPQRQQPGGGTGQPGGPAR